MKNFKKILIASLVAALVLVGCMVATFADDEYTGTLEELTALVEKAEAATGTAKNTALSNIAKYLDKTPVDPATEGYDAVMDRISVVTVVAATNDLSFASATTVSAATAYTGIYKSQSTLAMFEVKDDTAGFAEYKVKFDEAIVKTVKALLADVDANVTTTLKTAENQVAINKVKRVISDCKPYGEISLDAEEAQLAELEAKQAEAVKANLEALEEPNDITEYSLPIYHSFDAENVPLGLVNKSGKVGEWNFELKGTKNPIGILEEENGNRYVYSGYAPTTSEDKNTYVQLSLAAYKPDNGYVIEFDLTTFDKLPSAGIKIELGGFDMPDGRGFPPFLLVVSQNGDLIMGDAPNASDQNKVTAMSGAVVPGQWLHVAIIFDNIDFTYTLVVEGQKLTTTSAKYKGNAFDISKGVVRFGSSDVSGSVAFDNFVLYSGSNYRNPDRFSSMTDDEKFVYYTSYLSDESKDVNGKNTAYDMATGLLKKYWVYDEESGVGDYTDYAKTNPDLMSAVDAYLGFDFESLLAVVKLENLESLIDLVTSLKGIVRTPDSVNARKTKVQEIELFIEKYDGLINTEFDGDENGMEDYLEQMKTMDDVRRDIVYDENAVLFIRYMDRFQLVTAISAMQRYYDRAHALVTGGEVDVGIAINPDHESREHFSAFVSAYEVYVSSYDHIVAVKKNDNSHKIVTCIGFIDGFVTEEQWLENAEMMNKYLNIIKDSILYTDENGELLYNPEYEGVSEAVEFFNLAYAYFYNLKQQEHIDYMTEIFGLIDATESYIEKMGMVSMIDRYIAANELDRNDSRIVSLLNALETVRSELEVRREDYAKILIQNAIYFVNIVEDLRTSITYDEKVKLFEEASLLYFNIDVTVDGAAEAVAIYDQCKAELERAKTSSLCFLDAYDYYKACEDPDDIYAALVECYYYSQYVEESYYGVPEAMEEFMAEYDEYIGYVDAINKEIVSTGNLIGSLRANCGITPVIEIIIKHIYGE